MSGKKWVLRTLAVVAILTLLAGCGPAATPVVPTQAPTVDTAPTFAVIQTQAVQTAVANMTLNAPTATPVTPTNTPAPTETPAPTSTPLPPTATFTATFRPWTATPLPPTATPTSTDYSCSITSVSPKSGTEVAKDSDYDAQWVIKNTGAKTWAAVDLDFRYASGTKMHTRGDLADLRSDVAPGATYTLTLDMHSPADAGKYTETWVLAGNINVCTMSVSIEVK